MPKTKNTKKLKQDSATAIKSFSKNLLGLKFMQRAKKEVEKVEEMKDEGGSFNTSLCHKLKNKQQYIINHSYQFCERLKFGRLSFQGMNAEVEDLVSQNNINGSIGDHGKKRNAPT